MTAPSLVLGTVQLGAPYGVANKTGMPNEPDAIHLIQSAIRSGITEIDTARGYGESEARIGMALQGISFGGKVITKLRPPMEFGEETPLTRVRDFVRSEIDASCDALQRRPLDCVLLHRARHLIEWEGAIWSELLTLRKEGLIQSLGVSVQNVEETRMSLATEGVSHLQLAHNILDWRWKDATLDKELKMRTDVTVHARSTFLQGLLVAGDADLFPVIPKSDAEKTIKAIAALIEKLGRQSAADLCLAYVRSQDWIDGIVVGMETQEQLDDNLALFKTAPLTEEEQVLVENAMPHLPEQLLNPGLWSK